MHKWFLFPQRVRRIKNTVDRVRKQNKDSVSLLNSIPNLAGDQKNVKLVNYAASFLEMSSTCHSPLSTIEREEVHTDKSGSPIQMPNCGVKHLNLDLIFKNLPRCIHAVYSSQLSLNPLFFLLNTQPPLFWHPSSHDYSMCFARSAHSFFKQVCFSASAL